MNWLAHLYLSERCPAFRLGNVLADFLPPAALATLPADFQRGIEQHRRIDKFTDNHPAVRTGVERINPPFRRFGAILCDVFFDHFLARDWRCYSAEPLSEFTSAVYESFDEFRAHIPPDAYASLDAMRKDDWLGSYQSLSGVAQALQRIGSRFRRHVQLGPAISILEHNYALFHSDFCAFFPELRAHIGPNSAGQPAKATLA